MILDASSWIIKFPKVPFAHRVTESRRDKSYKSLQCEERETRRETARETERERERLRENEMWKEDNLCVVVAGRSDEIMFVLTTGDMGVRKHTPWSYPSQVFAMAEGARSWGCV